jgi:hypothetical protein
MEPPYPVISLPADASNLNEPMGTKRKFWFRHSDRAEWLFKYNRPGHGDDWSEGIACEIAGALGLSHACVELATFEGNRGVMSRDFTESGKFQLIHGNELLVDIINPRYPKDQNYKVTEHTVQSVRRALEADWITPRVLPQSAAALARENAEIRGVVSVSDLFAGYLILDALVGNTDRHHPG